MRLWALLALSENNPDRKVQAVQHLWAQRAETALDTHSHITTPPVALPGRPDRPLLIEAALVSRRSVHTCAGLAAMVHAVCHIEFNAINLALDAMWRFAAMPSTYYTDWLQVAKEEAHHFRLLQAHLQAMGHNYGDFEAHNGLWSMCEKTAHDVVARMALVPRTLEARGLDATPLIQAKLRKANTPQAQPVVAILDLILLEEIGHVAIGNHWYHWLCERDGWDPLEHYQVLLERHDAPRLKPPFNDSARKLAGFSQAELDALHHPL